MPQKRDLSRRQLLKAGIAASAAPMIVPSSVLGLNGQTPPSDRIALAGLGIGGRGGRDLESFLKQKDVQFLAICDVRNERREELKALADKHHGNNDCAMYSDQYELWERKDIDAVLIATGDRWHTLLSVMTAKSGKDVYCEKPCSMTMQETRFLADSFQRLGRVYQAGTQRRNGSNFNHAYKMLQDGKLGKIHTLHANVGPGDRWPPRTTHDWLPAEPVPPKQLVDWDRWLGPCPWRPYNSLYVKRFWRGYYDFHGGGILEWGSHTVDLCQWAGSYDETAPIEYEPVEEPGKVTPYAIHCRYADGTKLIMRDSGWVDTGSCATRWEGDNGWVETGDRGWVNTSDNLAEDRVQVDDSREATTYHVRDFLDCVKSRRQPRANALSAAQTHVACHAAYIAFQLGRKLRFDPARDMFLGDDEANRMRSRAMREPWRLV